MTTEEAVKRRNEAEGVIRDALKGLVNDLSDTTFDVSAIDVHLNMVCADSKEGRVEMLGSVDVNIELSDERTKRHDI